MPLNSSLGNRVRLCLKKKKVNKQTNKIDVNVGNGHFLHDKANKVSCRKKKKKKESNVNKEAKIREGKKKLSGSLMGSSP